MHTYSPIVLVDVLIHNTLDMIFFKGFAVKADQLYNIAHTCTEMYCACGVLVSLHKYVELQYAHKPLHA